ncbi:C6 transcription factor [Penicillium riverlandense]|uniref:C6 transcription factor n=1 Tax=Penicillium riverlandense TaxID=1903569 RepID=UPI002547B780|nr:C6 transcription factor [Penicillium riverlandense]KAJ5819704.1 C6 transcription factor [Penicillium riverlandense]
MQLNDKFSKWEEVQPNDFKPSTVGSMTGRGVFFDYGVGSWPGKVDTYFDPYVAGVWNAYRAARLLLIDLILQLTGIIDDDKDHDAELDAVLHVLEDMLSSIPYHLAEDVHIFLRDADSNSSIANPGRSVGGLLLMHSMHVVSNLLIINPQIRTYMKKRLVWMKQNMGIGLASILANVGIF